MKKILLLSLLIISMSTYSQNKKKASSPEKHTALGNTFEKGQLDVNLGIGLLANRYYYYSGSRISPPINLSIDKAVTENLSFGGFLAYVRSVYKNTGYYTYYDNNSKNWIYAGYNDKLTVTYGILGARGAFHLAQYIQVENLDLYAGAMLGWSFAKSTYYTDNSNGRANPYKTTGYGGLVAGFYVGGRYRFTEKIGVFGELGYGLSYGNFGLNLKF